MKQAEICVIVVNSTVTLNILLSHILKLKSENMWMAIIFVYGIPAVDNEFQAREQYAQEHVKSTV